MPTIVDSIRGEFLRYKALAEAAIAQLNSAELVASGPMAGNSVATIGWHVCENLRSRFTDFLTSDGEKPWRQRESEFEPREVTRDELLLKWEEGWQPLLQTLGQLSEADLARIVRIRGQPLTVHEAFHRSLAHVSYHVGQIVYLAKSFRGCEWQYLSIPPGGSAGARRDPARQSALAHAESLRSVNRP